MAAISVVKPTIVPGLHMPPTLADLHQSSNLYNQLPSDEAQPALLPDHSRAIQNILIRHNVHDQFGIHLIHGHFEIPTDKVMLGHYFEGPTGCWTKPIPIKDVDTANIHGHIFKLSTNRKLVAYEYRDGPPINVDQIDPSFFDEIFGYLVENNLTDTIGLQALSPGPSSLMIELVLGDTGIVMLNEAQAQYGKIYKTTGWHVDPDDGDELKDGEKHAETTKGTHRVFVDKVPLSDVMDLKNFLKKEEIIP